MLFTGDFRPWDVVRIVIALWFPWAMLTFYNTPLPGSTRSFTAAITEGGNWLQGVLIANTGEDYLVSFTRLSQNFFARASSMELGSGSGMMDIILNGFTNLSYLFMAFLHTVIFELFLLLILLCLVVIYAVSMGQVIWAQLALGVLLILGPLFIPFLLVEPLAFLFWGWFKGMFTYTLYGAIAAALMRVFLAASMGWIEAIMNGPPPGNSFWWHSSAWFLSVVPPGDRGAVVLAHDWHPCLANRLGRRRGRWNHGPRRPGGQWDFQTQNWRGGINVMAKPKDKESDAGREYAEIWGETIHSNRHLRVFSIVLGVLLLFVTIAVVRLSSVEPPRPIVVRVDEVGRADPRDPTTKYFLNRFLHDHFGRRRATAQQYWPRSLRFLSTDLANAAFTTTNEEIALLAAGITQEELRVENVVLRIQANPTEPHGAVADFALIRTRQEREVSREAWTATVQFVFMPVIPADLVIFNPMGIQITYLETDRTLITTETP